MSTETQEKATVAQTRTVTIVTTRGEKVKVPFEGTEWADLKKLLERGGKDVDGNSFSSYNLNNMKCVESTNRTTLEHPKAVIPDGNFNLFLMPYKSKSGAMSRADINAAIKAHIEKDGDKAKEFFGGDSGNYTREKSTTLEEKLEDYKPGTKKAAKAAKAQATANVADVVASVKDSKEADLFEELQGLTTDEKLDIVIKLLIDMKNGKPATQVTEVVSEPVESEEDKAARLQAEEDARIEAEKKAEEDRIKEEKRKAKEAEDKKLEAEMEDLAAGFSDVRL